MVWLRTVFVALALMLVAACQSPIEANNMCIFADRDLVAPNTSPEAERLFQQGRAHDVNVISDMPETLPDDLKGQTPDRAIARSFYQQAAELGHTGAMNNLAVYLHEGWGEGRGNYVPNMKGAYAWNVEMARRGDARGYVGMAAYLFGSDLGPANPQKAVACLVAGSKQNHTDAIRLLAIDDLGQREIGPAEARQPERIKRGIALLEELFRRGQPIAYMDLAEYHKRATEDWAKYEYYARAATAAGAWQGRIDLVGVYQNGLIGRDATEEATCLNDLARSDLRALETRCPRPNGPMTRDAAGLGAAPVALDIPQYLADFAAQFPDISK